MLLTLTLLSALGAAPAADSIAGAWRLKSEVGGTAWEQTCTVKQEAAALSGSCTGDDGVSWVLTGAVRDGKATFEHGGKYEGNDITIVFSVASASPSELKGTIVVKPFDAPGTFTAAPVPTKK